MTTSSAMGLKPCVDERSHRLAERHNRPFALNTEASIDLADRKELLAAMVEANFMYVFIGIESPSAGSAEGKPEIPEPPQGQPPADPQIIQESGLWVLGGFIVGFDSDDETIFERQREFIEQSRHPLGHGRHAASAADHSSLRPDEARGPPARRQRRTSNFSAPNFDTVMPDTLLMRGLADLLARLYHPEIDVGRSLRSLEAWCPDPQQKPPPTPFLYTLRMWLASVWQQGIRSSYRKAYWKFSWTLVSKYALQPARPWIGFMTLLSAHHFVLYAKEVATELEQECRNLEMTSPATAECPVGANTEDALALRAQR